jgi:hypothetical protein
MAPATAGAVFSMVSSYGSCATDQSLGFVVVLLGGLCAL